MESQTASPCSIGLPASHLNGETLHLVTHGADLASQFAGIVARDASSNNGSADAASTAEVHLAADVDVGDTLVLAK